MFNVHVGHLHPTFQSNPAARQWPRHHPADRGVAAGHAPLPPHPHRSPDVSGALPEQFGPDSIHFFITSDFVIAGEPRLHQKK